MKAIKENKESKNYPRGRKTANFSKNMPENAFNNKPIAVREYSEPTQEPAKLKTFDIDSFVFGGREKKHKLNVDNSEYVRKKLSSDFMLKLRELSKGLRLF
jgi:hypothetical protein